MTNIYNRSSQNLAGAILYDVSHNVESQYEGLVDVKLGLYKKRLEGKNLRKIFRIIIVIENVYRTEGTLMHYDGHPRLSFAHSFKHYQVQKIKKKTDIFWQEHSRAYFFKVEQIHLHICLEHSNVVFILLIRYRHSC